MKVRRFVGVCLLIATGAVPAWTQAPPPPAPNPPPPPAPGAPPPPRVPEAPPVEEAREAPPSVESLREIVEIARKRGEEDLARELELRADESDREDRVIIRKREKRSADQQDARDEKRFELRIEDGQEKEINRKIESEIRKAKDEARKSEDKARKDAEKSLKEANKFLQKAEKDQKARGKAEEKLARRKEELGKLEGDLAEARAVRNGLREAGPSRKLDEAEARVEALKDRLAGVREELTQAEESRERLKKPEPLPPTPGSPWKPEAAPAIRSRDLPGIPPDLRRLYRVEGPGSSELEELRKEIRGIGDRLGRIEQLIEELHRARAERNAGRGPRDPGEGPRFGGGPGNPPGRGPAPDSRPREDRAPTPRPRDRAL